MSMVSNHPIVLEWLLYTKVHVEAIPNHVPIDPPTSEPPVNNLVVQLIEPEAGRYTAVMTCTVNAAKSDSSPYVCEIECQANFVADKSLDADQAARGVTITANSVIFGAIRETVAWLTSRQPYGPLLLGLSVLQSQPAATVETVPKS